MVCRDSQAERGGVPTLAGADVRCAMQCSQQQTAMASKAACHDWEGRSFQGLLAVARQHACRCCPCRRCCLLCTTWSPAPLTPNTLVVPRAPTARVMCDRQAQMQRSTAQPSSMQPAGGLPAQLHGSHCFMPAPGSSSSWLHSHAAPESYSTSLRFTQRLPWAEKSKALFSRMLAPSPLD